MMTEEQKRSMAASLDAAYPRLVAQFASDPSHSRLWPGAAKLALICQRKALLEGRFKAAKVPQIRYNPAP